MKDANNTATPVALPDALLDKTDTPDKIDNTNKTNTPDKINTCTKPKKIDKRVGALRRFAIAITVLTTVGHLFLGFETAPLSILVALLTTYSVDLLLETVEARSRRRAARYRGGVMSCIDFLLPAHISGLAIAMLLYPAGTLLPIVFAATVAMGSKNVFRAPLGNGWRHFLNPSNAGIAVVLLLCPWVGITPPYQFTENVAGAADWWIPAIIIASGTFLNAVFTGRVPLIVAWVFGFALQAIVRALLFDVSVNAALAPMTGMAFLLYTFYMISDPGTTPFNKRHQVYFGLAIAVAYGVLMSLHVVFTLFFALLVVCILRGLRLHLVAWLARPAPDRESAVITARVAAADVSKGAIQ